MKPEIYETMAKVEDTHWWFRGRRAISKHVISTLALPEKPVILDAGCGTGGNLGLLSRFGDLYAMEMDENARRHANHRGVTRVEYGKLPEAIPFGKQPFDLITMFDVLEHIDDDAAALHSLVTRLNAGGYLLLTVPAFPFLWSTHDESHHHKRRYRMKPLKKLVEQAGLKVTFASHINFFLFPVVAAVRLAEKIKKPNATTKGGNEELVVPSPMMNDMLAGIFAFETRFFSLTRLPFGVSILLVAQKP